VLIHNMNVNRPNHTSDGRLDAVPNRIAGVRRTWQIAAREVTE
jgi:hypothetical protein